ncbi:MAG: U32 family peptidase [Lachnospiraceae bacterium]|nr:U32 family peptidase [Lachnospiraceae bacterium]
MRKPELLLPAGSMETMETAVRYGADAVYSGGKKLSLRAKAHNFTVEELRNAILLAHAEGVLVYVTANIFARESDLAEAIPFFRELQGLPPDARPDGLLVADPGMLVLAGEHCPGIPVHLSTQANTTNALSCRFWYDAGVRRVVLARELSLSQIRGIREQVPGELSLECFVHGAMCISYSGRCLLSRAMTGRDANGGACAHPCRYRYALVEEKRPGEYMPVEEDAQGTEILASNDLCMLEHLPALMEAGVDSFKIEGRMKNALYVGGVARAYRAAIDLITDGREEEYRAAIPALLKEVRAVSTRELTTGFYFEEELSAGDPGKAPLGTRRFLGVVQGTTTAGDFYLEQRNRFAAGDVIRPMKRTFGKDPCLRVRAIYGEDGEPVREAVHPKERVRVITDVPGAVEAGDVLYEETGDGQMSG